ncbi:uncharacterized protein LOC144916734 [Branchiostoma floridae x Branchiostoma belcheri]
MLLEGCWALGMGKPPPTTRLTLQLSLLLFCGGKFSNPEASYHHGEGDVEVLCPKATDGHALEDLSAMPKAAATGFPETVEQSIDIDLYGMFPYRGRGRLLPPATRVKDKSPMPDASPVAPSPSPAATHPSTAFTRPSTAVIHPSPAAIHPSTAFTRPSTAVIHPSPAAIHPSPAFTRPSTAATLPCTAATLPCTAATLPSTAATLPSTAARCSSGPVGTRSEPLQCASLRVPVATGSERQPQCAHRASAVQEVLQKLANSGPAIAPWEDELLLQLVRRQLAAAADGKTITCKTGGLPITLLKVSKARKATGEASTKTGQRRTGEVKAVREIVSGGDTDGQMGLEMKSLGREALQNILRQMDLSAIQIPTGHLLSAQLDIGINYNQCRKLRRWLKQHLVSVESEHESRRVAGEMLAGRQVVSEMLPLTVRTKDQRKEVAARPCAYVSCLESAVLDILTRNATAGELTWFEGTIPESEVWIKFLGDHGGGSFKLGFQVLNRMHPNAAHNTNIVCLFKAKDTRENLLSATSNFCKDIGTLQTMSWRSPQGSVKRVRVFGAGDYHLLSLWYGLSGACGTHPCLWCQVSKVDMKKAKNQRQQSPARTLTEMAEHHRQFRENGQGELRKAKEYQNVIAPR